MTYTHDNIRRAYIHLHRAIPNMFKYINGWPRCAEQHQQSGIILRASEGQPQDTPGTVTGTSKELHQMVSPLRRWKEEKERLKWSCRWVESGWQQCTAANHFCHCHQPFVSTLPLFVPALCQGCGLGCRVLGIGSKTTVSNIFLCGHKIWTSKK